MAIGGGTWLGSFVNVFDMVLKATWNRDTLEWNRYLMGSWLSGRFSIYPCSFVPMDLGLTGQVFRSDRKSKSRPAVKDITRQLLAHLVHLSLLMCFFNVIYPCSSAFIVSDSSFAHVGTRTCCTKETNARSAA